VNAKGKVLACEWIYNECQRVEIKVALIGHDKGIIKFIIIFYNKFNII
jgi:hypothetical protein